MPKKKQLSEGEAMSVQVAVRITPTMLDRLEQTGGRLGLDNSSLIRLVLNRYMPVFEAMGQLAQNRKAPTSSAE